MKKIIFINIILTFIFACSNNNQIKKINSKTDNLSPTLNKQENIHFNKESKKNINFITNSISKNITNNPRRKIDTFYNSKIKYIDYMLNNELNDWTLRIGFYDNGLTKEKGLFLNGWRFGKWYEYNKTGKIISEIDYTNSKIIVYPKTKLDKKFMYLKKKSDSLLINRFGNSFFEKHIKFNFNNSYWYTKNNSGNYLENSKLKPNKYLLRYSIVFNDTIIYTTIKLEFNKNKNESKFNIKNTNGIPDKKYNMKISYKEASKIANNNGFGLKKSNTEFSKNEFLNLFFDKKHHSYNWSISSIEKTSYTENINGKILSGNGKTLIINASNGNTKISNFNGKIIYD